MAVSISESPSARSTPNRTAASSRAPPPAAILAASAILRHRAAASARDLDLAFEAGDLIARVALHCYARIHVSENASIAVEILCPANSRGTGLPGSAGR